MKNYTSLCRKMLFVFGFFPTLIFAQKTQIADSTAQMNMDAVLERPTLTGEKAPVSIGGYLEANSYHRTEEGISDGLSFQARRLTLFMAASISERIRFLTEIEFEDGGNEIAIEFAAMDVALHPMLNFRGGIVMNPIGAFNENHDGPKWEFVERPDVSINLLAATLSSAGFGIYGKTYKNNWIFGYEAYLTNGLNSKIISNQNDKTFLPAAKDDPNRFEENHSGMAMFTGKLAVKHRKFGEIGFSHLSGVYNKFEDDGEVIEDKAHARVYAIDLNTAIRPTRTQIIGEIAWIAVETPKTYTQQYGNKQYGFFVDVIQPVFVGKVLEWEQATLNFSTRLDYVDWNVGRFHETQTRIGDELIAVTPSISFRPTPKTVFRINYRYEWQRDIIRNPYEKAATWLIGFSTYF